MFVERLNSQQNRICSSQNCVKSALPNRSFSSLPKMTSDILFSAEISNFNIFHITQYFWVKSYKRNHWNLPNIFAYISGIFDDFFKGGLVLCPFSVVHDAFYHLL